MLASLLVHPTDRFEVEQTDQDVMLTIGGLRIWLSHEQLSGLQTLIGQSNASREQQSSPDATGCAVNAEIEMDPRLAVTDEHTCNHCGGALVDIAGPSLRARLCPVCDESAFQEYAA